MKKITNRSTMYIENVPVRIYIEKEIIYRGNLTNEIA